METKKSVEDRVEEAVKDELDPVDTEAEYRQMLDDCYDFSSVGGPFAHMSPAKVLEEMDPVAYRCGKNDWEDGESRERWEEIDGDYYDKDEVAEIRQRVEDENEVAEQEGQDD